MCAMDACYSEWSDQSCGEATLESSTLRHVLAYLPFWGFFRSLLGRAILSSYHGSFGLGRQWLVQSALPVSILLACRALH